MYKRRKWLFPLCGLIFLLFHVLNCSVGMAAEVPLIFEDIGLKGLSNEERPKSAWIENQKAMFRDFIKDRTSDVMVVPIQVQGYAIDRPGRSLMSRYLSDYIEKTTSLKVADVSLVARALGENLRTFDSQDIYNLANSLGIKTLITGYVGHNLDGKMVLSILVQERGADGLLTSSTKVLRLDWKDIEFSDEVPPSAVFAGMLGEISAKLPIKKVKEYKVGEYKKVPNIPVPATAKDMISSTPTSLLVGAYYLQYIGLLYPENTTAKGHLFERALTALRSVSPNSPDYPLLKARALFYLHRRPAAMAALTKLTSPEEKAFVALINGNLPELKRLIHDIKSPLPKLMAQIELNDLQWSYGQQPSSESIIQEHPVWAEILGRRFSQEDSWDVQSNLDVKQIMDDAFPIKDFTAKSIMSGRMTLGQSPLSGEIVDLCSYRHYSQWLAAHRKTTVIPVNDTVNEIDYLDLLYHISEANLIKGLEKVILNQDLGKEGVALIDSYSSIYRDHPGMTALRGVALHKIFQRTKDKSLLKDSNKLLSNAAYWFQEKKRQKNYPYSIPAFDADYPCYGVDRRVLKGNMLFEKLISVIPKEDKLIKKTQGNIELNEQNLASLKRQIQSSIVGLKYSHDDYSSVISLVDRLLEYELNEQARIVIDTYNDRFDGNPKKSKYLSKIVARSNDSEKVVKTFEAEIAKNPDVFSTYRSLAEFYIKRGESSKAVAVLNRYPFFINPNKGDRVDTSGNAFIAARSLYLTGRMEEAIPFFKIAADSGTGSDSEMQSAYFLYIVEGNYMEAAQHGLDMINRYDDGYIEYLSMLYLLGYRDKAWSVINTLELENYTPDIWIPLMVGLRIDSKTNEEIVKWIMEGRLMGVNRDDIELLILRTHLIDRKVDDKSISTVLNSVISNFKANQYRSSTDKEPYLGWFGDSYLLIKKGQHEHAFDMLSRKSSDIKTPLINYQIGSLPYYIWSGLKSGKKEIINKYFSEMSNEEMKDGFDYQLSFAVYHGLQADHKAAIEYLKKASYRIPFIKNRPLFPWNQLVEICDWLYQDTKVAVYRDLALEFAKAHQRVWPMYSWAYAVEAKYTSSEQDRIRALAITLYLDKNSERISAFSESEKNKALKWLEKNNPFKKDNKVKGAHI